MTTALMIGPLRGKPIIYTNVSPTMGDINIYNTTTAASALTMTLPQLGLGVQTIGAIALLEKDVNDETSNTLTFNCYTGDTFVGGATALVLTTGGSQRTLEVVSVAGVVQWKIVSGFGDAPTPLSSDTVNSNPVDQSSADPFGVNPYDSVPVTDLAAEPTRFGEQLLADTGYGRYGDGVYGYGHY